MKISRNQLIGVIIISISLGLIVFQATRGQSTVTFYTPEEVYAAPRNFKDKVFRVSGLVIKGSKIWEPKNSKLFFKISDLKGHDFFVSYKGVPPDLFKEGQGVVVEGALSEQSTNSMQGASNFLIKADLLLVKHSEVYDTKSDHSKIREAKLLDSMIKKEVGSR